MANVYHRSGDRTNQFPFNASIHSTSDDGLAQQSSALTVPDQADLLSAMFLSTSVPRSFPSQAFQDPSSYSSVNEFNGEDSGQQHDLTLSGTNDTDFPFSLDSTLQDSGPTPTFQHELKRHQRRYPTSYDPWTPVRTAGVPDLTRLRTQTNSHANSYLSPQNQAFPHARTPSGRTSSDSGYYTLPSLGRQDTNPCETETIGTADELIEGLQNFEVMSHRSASMVGGSSFDPNQQPQQVPIIRTSQRHSQGLVPNYDEESLNTCNLCRKQFSTPSLLTKHQARHILQYKCDVPGCKRVKGFSTSNDLDRHKKTVHKQTGNGRVWKCFGSTCVNTTKRWPRLDNFKTHLEKIHQGEDAEDLIKQSDDWFDNQTNQAVETDGRIVSTGPQMQATTSSLSTSMMMSGNQTSMRAVMHGSGQPPTTISPQDMYHDNQLLTVPDWHQRPQSAAHRIHSVSESPMVDSTMPRTASSTGATGLNSARASVSSSQPSMHRPRVNQTQTQRYQGHANRPVTPQSQSATPGHRLPQSTSSENHENFFVYSARISPANHDATLLDVFQNSRYFSNKANTAPVEMPPLQARLNDLEPTIPQPPCTTPGSIGQNLLAVGSASHLSDAPAGSPSDELSIGGDTDQCTAENNQTENQRNSKILEAVLSTLQPGIDKDFVSQIVDKTIKAANSRGPSSVTTTVPRDVVTPASAPAQTIKGPNGKEILHCPDCQKVTNRPSEMSKHRRRHTKPYGCTFERCYKKFGSKNDLKRHEHSQHEQHECWRCEEPDKDNNMKMCAKVLSRRDLFAKHLQEDHGITKPALRDAKLKKQRISRAHQINYWCGFCQRICTMIKKGIPGDNERFDHIVKHFIGDGLNIDDWLPAHGDKTKGVMRKEWEAARLLNPGAPESAEPAPQKLEGGDDQEEEEEEDDDDDCEDESEETSPDSSQLDQAMMLLDQQQQQPYTPSQHYHPITSHLATPPATGNSRKRKGAPPLPPPPDQHDHRASSSRNVRRGKPAEFVICCHCPGSDAMAAVALWEIPENVQLLVNSKTCSECQHRFCTRCEYRVGTEQHDDVMVE